MMPSSLRIISATIPALVSSNRHSHLVFATSVDIAADVVVTAVAASVDIAAVVTAVAALA